jgi:hypothetical protein
MRSSLLQFAMQHNMRLACAASASGVLTSSFCAGPSTRPPRIVGHRGGSASAPENTKASIEWAFAHGADGVEMDLQQTKDGTIILLHDDSLARTATLSAQTAAEFERVTAAPVAELNFADIKDIDIGSWKDKTFASERLITFEESLHILAKENDSRKYEDDSNLFYLVEIKGGDYGIVPELKRIVEKMGANATSKQVDLILTQLTATVTN